MKTYKIIIIGLCACTYIAMGALLNSYVKELSKLKKENKNLIDQVSSENYNYREMKLFHDTLEAKFEEYKKKTKPTDALVKIALLPGIEDKGNAVNRAVPAVVAITTGTVIE